MEYMNVKKVLMLFIIIFLICIGNVKAAEPEITATSATVIDCIDGKFLYSKNAEEKLYPASLTKVLTAIVVVENTNLQDEVTISNTAIKNVESGYLTSNLEVGEILTVEQLLNLMLISSYNDVANVLAEHIGGSIEGFVDMMNQKANEIGCTNSHFMNCNGTHNENHYTTAHDLALIGKYAMQYDSIKEVVGKTHYDLGATNKYIGEDRSYYTSNEMLLSSSSNYYKYASGIKTGFTTPAGNCFMAYAVRYDIPCVAVVLKSTTSDSKYEDTKSILNYAFTNNTIRTIATLGTNVQTVNVRNATHKTKKLNAVLEKTIIAVVNEQNKDTSLEAEIHIADKLKAPIEKGTVIGTATYEIEGKKYTENLIAESDVEKSNLPLIYVIIFIVILAILGSARIMSVNKRKKVLNKIRNK